MVVGRSGALRARRVAVALIAAGAAAAVAEPLPAQEPADVVVTNATIHTADPAAPRAEAMAISGGVIVAIGAAGEVERYRGPGTTAIDLEGRAVIPGLIDAHAHVFNLGKFLRTIDLIGTSGIEEIVARVRETAAGRPAEEWILGRGWDQNDWTVKEFPTFAALDAAAPGHPVWLTRVDGHAGWANSHAMELAGITATTPDPEGGRIVRDAAGNATGVFIDNAEDLIDAAIPAPGREELAARLAAAQDRMVSVGLTGVHDMGTEPAEVELFREWAQAGRLLPRIVSYLDSSDTTLMGALESLAAARSVGPGDRFRISGVKFYADGALGSRGAALLAPYSDDPGNEGLLVTPPEELEAGVARAVGLGLQPAIHAIGDRGNRLALDAIQAAGEGGRPSRIEHAQVVALDDIPRFADLGVIASMQPTHATSDMYWAEERVGPERIRGAYAWRRMLDAGVPLACGSDFPVESPNPFWGLFAAVTRQDQEGWPAGGWRPEERLTREEALACFTRWAAHAAGMGDDVGTLAVGRRADFLVLDRDVLEVPADEIGGTRVLRTVIDGETVYESNGSSISHAQEAIDGAGLEVDDPTRLGVSLVPGLGIDHESIQEILAEEFALAGVEITDQQDPQKNEVLVIWTGQAQSQSEDSEGTSTFALSDFRMEFWRPVRYETREGGHLGPGMTWVMRGEASGGYTRSHSLTEAVCTVVSQNLRSFLVVFLQANGEAYAPPEDPPSGCETAQL